MNMSPDASPGFVSRPGAGVRRVNNVPVYIGLAVLTVFLVIMGLVAADRAAQQNLPLLPDEEKAGDASVFAKQIAGDQPTGMIAAKALQPLAVPADPGPKPPLRATASTARPAAAAPPTPPRPGTSARDEELTRLRNGKMQALVEASRAKTAVQVVVPRGADEGRINAGRVGAGGGVGGSMDPTAAYQARLAQMQGQGAGLGGLGAGGKNNIAQFGNAGQGDRWRLDSQPEAPRSRYALRAGFVIPSVLMSGINSELPGQIMAQVSQNVYDTPTGKYLLIPLGSRLVGAYASDVAYGQSRVLVAWQRIVFPDGKAMDIGAMPGADGAGYAGFNDKVNNHYVRLFGSAILLSAVTAGITYSQDQTQQGNSYGPPTASSALSEALGQQLGQVTAQLLSKNMNIAPTLEIRPGYRFNVIVTKDLTFSKPYQSFDY